MQADSLGRNQYVAGLLFNRTRTFIAVVRKNRPAWQIGKINGIGGKVESGETPTDAMVREFREETGATIDSWHMFAQMQGDAYVVYYYRAFSAVDDLSTIVSTQEAEPILVLPIHALEAFGPVRNLPWLAKMALAIEDGADDHFTITERPVIQAQMPDRFPNTLA